MNQTVADEAPVFSRDPPQRLCAFVIKALTAMTAVNSFALVSLCVATEGTVRYKATYQPVSVTMVLTGVHANGVYRSLQDLNVINALQTTSAGQSAATFIVSMATQQGKTKISARVTMTPT